MSDRESGDQDTAVAGIEEVLELRSWIVRAQMV
jgi:hypothetical protein